MPTFDKSSVTGSVTQTIPGSTSGCPNANWAANTKFTGNVSAGSLFLGCTVTITGNIYITGDLTIKSSLLRVSDSAGNNPPVIIVDGKVTLNQVEIGKNSKNTGVVIISFDSSSSSCSHDAACTVLPTNGDVQSSIARTSIDATFENDLSGSILWAYFGGVSTMQTALSGAYGQRLDLRFGTIEPFPAGSTTNVIGSSSSSYKIIDYLPVYD
ncbi:MAG: hypothetical protein WAS27_02880 [Candidatus Saccharimonadales bacterium]